ncbi:uncharacterized protein LOC135943955 [Cloeon dipterum]|uniref:uncharacterized protein LOC135943955 n=1 Tax=Cloeon dipterum TaxID=197152 RepID=UPI00322020B0
MQAERNYFAFCLDKNTRINYFIVPSKYLNPRPKARHLNPGVVSDTLGKHFWGAVFQSAWHESFEVDPDDGSFLDKKPKTDEDFEHLLIEAEHKECVVLATASSVQELQKHIKASNIKLPRKYRRLDFTVASGSQENDEPQKDNDQFRSKTSNIDNTMALESSKESNSSTSFGGDTNKRPVGVAKLGFFEIDGRETIQNADNICVLVIDYLCRDRDKCIKNGDACDVEDLRTIFEKNRNCNFRDCSKNKNDLLELLGDQQKLMDFFNLKGDVPSVFVLFILSHGGKDGKIETDDKELFTTDEVLDKLQGLERFQNCLKIVNFAPCRGPLEDSKYDTNKSNTNYDNRNSCRITTRPGMHNFVVFYSTVETTMARGDTAKSTWFVRDICTCLNDLKNDEPLLKFFTIVQNRRHETLRVYWTNENNRYLGQTPELKMFTQERKFIISKPNITEKLSGSNDDIADMIKDDPYFSWESDDKKDIRGRSGFILSAVKSDQVRKMETVLQSLDFEVAYMNLTELIGYDDDSDKKKKEVFKLEPDVGCILACIFGPVCEKVKKDESKKEEEDVINEVCVRVEKDREIPITDILHRLVGPNNNTLIGKPKILFVVNVEAPETYHFPVDKEDLQVSATNHSGWLVLILKYEGAAKELIELFGKIDEKKSLQELLEPLLITRESNREDAVLLNSTLQYLIKFPIWPRTFVKPEFKLKKTKIPTDHMVSFKISTKSANEEKIDFDTLLKNATQLIEKNKKSFAFGIERFGKIDENSLQDDNTLLPTRESNGDDVNPLVSTLQNSMKFQKWSQAFVKPEIELKNTKITEDEIDSSNISTKSPIEENIDFNVSTEKTKRLTKGNENSTESKLQTVGNKFSSDAETSIKSHQVKNAEDISVLKDSVDASFFWLINSVAGAGKSTVLKEIRYQLTKNDGRFKILLIPLKKYYQYIFDMPALEVNEIEFLAETTRNSHDNINNWIKKGEVVVCLDGFDEMCPDFREKILKVVFALNNARVPLFVGTRPHEVHHIQERIKNTTIVEIEPLDEAKQIEFLQTVARKDEQDINQLRENFKDKDILGNPLYLTLLAEYNGGGNLYDIFDTIVRRKVELCLKREHGDIDVGKEMVDKSLKIIQLVAFRFVRGVKIDQGSVTKEELEKINAFGVVTYCNDTVNFTHQVFAEFLTAQKFIYDLKNPGPEKVPLFHDELVQCRKFVDLFFSMEKGKDATYAEAFVQCAKFTDPLKLVSQICRENLRQMFELLNPDLSLKDEDGRNALHFALRHLEMVKMVHKKNDKLADQETNNGESCLHLAIDDEEYGEEVALWLLQNTEVDKNAETKPKNTPLLLAGARKKWEVVEKLVFSNVELNKSSPDGKSILHYAMLSNQLDLVKRLIDRGSNVCLRDQNGDTPLHIAARFKKNSEIVKILLEKGAKINEQNNHKWRALHFAAKFNPTSEILQMLIKNGADVHLKDKDGSSALHLASGFNTNPDIVKNLLKKGAKVNEQDNDKWTALHFAAKFNPTSEILQMLIEHGADVHLKDKDGSSALQLASGFNTNPAIVNILLEKGAKINEQNNHKWRALHFAAKFNPTSEILQMLIKNGADVHLKDKDGSSALQFASGFNTNPAIVNILLEKGAKINEQNNHKWTALHFAAKFNPTSEILQMLIKNGADVHLKDKDGSSALQFASGFNTNPAIVNILLEKGAKINEQNNHKWTALHFAAKFNPTSEILQMLIKNGADVHLKDKDGSSALQFASGFNTNPAIVNILLEKGAKINEQNNHKWTALHFAAKFNPTSEILQMLIKNGADVHLKDKYGSSALQLASGFNTNPEIVNILLEKGAKINEQNNHKWTALHFAAKFNPTSEILKMLIEKGADVQLQTEQEKTALHLAARYNKNPEIVKILLEKDSDLKAKDNEKWNALHLAAKFNPSSQIVQMLLENGADVHSQVEDGSSALHLAAGWNTNPEIVQILIKKGAKVNARDNDKWTALHYAARLNSSPEVVQTLLENGAKINVENDNGETALFLAAKHNPVKEVAQKLLDNRAKVNKMIRNDKEVFTALRKMKEKPRNL